MIRPQRRLNTIDELQWELEAWISHYAMANEDGSAPHIEHMVTVLEQAAQKLFKAFGQPDAADKHVQ